MLSLRISLTMTILLLSLMNHDSDVVLEDCLVDDDHGVGKNEVDDYLLDEHVDDEHEVDAHDDDCSYSEVAWEAHPFYSTVEDQLDFVEDHFSTED